MLGTLGESGWWNFILHNCTYVDKVWYQNFVILKMSSILIKIPTSNLPLALISVVLMWLLILGNLRIWRMLVLKLWLILKWWLLVLANRNIWIWVVCHGSHISLKLRVEVCHHNACLPFLFLSEATLWFLGHCLSIRNVDNLPSFQTIFNMFAYYHSVIEI